MRPEPDMTGWTHDPRPAAWLFDRQLAAVGAQTLLTATVLAIVLSFVGLSDLALALAVLRWFGVLP